MQGVAVHAQPGRSDEEHTGRNVAKSDDTQQVVAGGVGGDGGDQVALAATYQRVRWTLLVRTVTDGCA